jgi:hypothetical protein
MAMMRSGLAWMFATVLPAAIACGGHKVIADWGLHREWAVQANCAHPERPAVLVEIPWKEPTAATEVGRKSSPGTRVADSSPLVRPGTRVMVFSHSGGTEIRLVGVALDHGCSGATVRVRAGLHGAILRGIVRGPAEVELISSKGRP